MNRVAVRHQERADGAARPVVDLDRDRRRVEGLGPAVPVPVRQVGHLAARLLELGGDPRRVHRVPAARARERPFPQASRPQVGYMGSGRVPSAEAPALVSPAVPRWREGLTGGSSLVRGPARCGGRWYRSATETPLRGPGQARPLRLTSRSAPTRSSNLQKERGREARRRFVASSPRLPAPVPDFGLGPGRGGEALLLLVKSLRVLLSCCL